MKKTAIAVALFLAASSAFAGQRGGGMGAGGARGTGMGATGTGNRGGATNPEAALALLTQQEEQLTQEVQLIDQVLQAVLAGKPGEATAQAAKQMEDAVSMVKQRQAEYKTAQNIAPNAEKEYQETKARLIKEIQEIRPEYKTAADAEAAAKAKMDAANQACIALLAKTNSYQKAKKIATEDEAKVKALRNADSPDELAKASEKWMDSSSSLREMENKATSTDPKSVAAQKIYYDAHLSVVALNTQYEKEIASNSELVAIKIKTADASKEIDIAKQELARATEKRDLAQKQLSQINSFINNPTSARSTLITKQRQLADITSQIQQIKARSNGANGGGGAAAPDQNITIPVGRM